MDPDELFFKEVYSAYQTSFQVPISNAYYVVKLAPSKPYFGSCNYIVKHFAYTDQDGQRFFVLIFIRTHDTGTGTYFLESGWTFPARIFNPPSLGNSPEETLSRLPETTRFIVETVLRNVAFSETAKRAFDEYGASGNGQHTGSESAVVGPAVGGGVVIPVK